MLELTEGQANGLGLANSLRTTRSVGIIAGYAGTGKTTLIGEILKDIGPSILLCPTGKAASRLRDLSGARATTVHSWLYNAEHDGKFVSFTRRPLEKIPVPQSGVIIVDEASMISADVWNDINETAHLLGCGVLLVGDPFQLPPVAGPNDEAFSVFENLPRVQRVDLTEILRQAEDSPIIRLSMQIREGDVFDALADADHLLENELVPHAAENINDDGMVICYSNIKRHQLNQAIRAEAGRGVALEANEPLLVMRNNHDTALFNGEVHALNSIGDDLGLKDVQIRDGHSVKLGFKLANVSGNTVVICPDIIMGKAEFIPTFKVQKAVEFYRKRGESYLDCNLGYTLTAHKAQGSQAKSVVVCLERNLRLNTEMGRRWCYSAATRAAERLYFCSLP